MPASTFRHLCYAGFAMALALPACALADSTGTYLTWQNKVSAGVEPQSDEPPAAMAYPAPPSPYGQVGDPFRRNLNWPSKKTPQDLPKPSTQPQTVKPQAASEGPRSYLPAHSQPLPAQPVQAVASHSETPKPAPPKPAPKITHVEPAPLPPVLATAKPVPAPQPHPPHTATASITAPTPLPAAKPVVAPPQAVAAAHTPPPQKAPAKPAVAPAAAPTAAPAQAQAQADDGYQVPATSKYAAQIKAARAAQARDLARQKAEEQAQDQATAPDPSEQLAVHETDHVFIPGETYKDEGDAPRLYSLHRMYGLQPDPITVTPEANGTILDGADLHADEAAPKTPAPKNSAKDTTKDSGKEPAKSAKAKSEGK